MKALSGVEVPVEVQLIRELSLSSQLQWKSWMKLEPGVIVDCEQICMLKCRVKKKKKKREKHFTLASVFCF